MMLTKSKTSINTSKKLFSATFKRKCETVLENGLLCYSTRISAYPSKEKRIIELLKKQRYLPKDISKLVYYGETIFQYRKTTANLPFNSSNLLRNGSPKIQNTSTCRGLN